MDQPEQYRQSMAICSHLYNDAMRRVLADSKETSEIEAPLMNVEDW